MRPSILEPYANDGCARPRDRSIGWTRVPYTPAIASIALPSPCPAHGNIHSGVRKSLILRTKRYGSGGGTPRDADIEPRHPEGLASASSHCFGIKGLGSVKAERGACSGRVRRISTNPSLGRAHPGGLITVGPSWKPSDRRSGSSFDHAGSVRLSVPTEKAYRPLRCPAFERALRQSTRSLPAGAALSRRRAAPARRTSGHLASTPSFDWRGGNSGVLAIRLQAGSRRKPYHIRQAPRVSALKGRAATPRLPDRRRAIPARLLPVSRSIAEVSVTDCCSAAGAEKDASTGYTSSSRSPLKRPLRQRRAIAPGGVPRQGSCRADATDRIRTRSSRQPMVQQPARSARKGWRHV